LADLMVSFQLYAVCTDCQRMERVPVQQLMERYGGDLTIDSVRRRLRCAGCSQRTGDIRIIYVGEQGRVSGFHYRADAQPFRSSTDSSVRPNPETPT
jgi:hypothetical protein